jgi:hypothetical protein
LLNTLTLWLGIPILWGSYSVKLRNEMKKHIMGVALLLAAGVANAAVVTYTLEDVLHGVNPGFAVTGTFDWTYTEDDFENGVGVFNEIFVPGWGTDLSGLVTTIDTTSIEISLLQNLDNKNVAENIKFINALTPTSGSDIDLTLSKWEDITGGKHNYLSGTITPTVVPIPPAAWLMLAGLLGLVTAARR